MARITESVQAQPTTALGQESASGTSAAAQTADPGTLPGAADPGLPFHFSVSAPNTSSGGFAALERATADMDGPFAVLDLAALRSNAADLLRRSAGKSIRVASKSVRCREVLRAVLDLPGYHGIMAYSLAEAHWLAAEFDDVLLAYPTADRAALSALAEDAKARERITLMVDSAEHLQFLARYASAEAPLRLCIDLDASLRVAGGAVHLGMRRSPVHSAEEASRLTRMITAHPSFTLVAVMSYEGQIAGLGDDAGSLLHRLQMRAVRGASIAELAPRRAEVIAAVVASIPADAPPLEFVNGGGTGSFESTAAEDAITELAAGSGLYCPTLFDGYRAFQPRPAAFFALTVVRKPGPGYATCLGGGWIASGPAGKDRLPTPAWPSGLSLLSLEGAGEVQTPVRGAAADTLKIGDKVWFRHTKAGELCEHVDELHVVDGDQIVARIPTYRGEGRTFLG